MVCAGHDMVDESYFRRRAERYFRIARAKSDRKMATRLEAMGYEFLRRAAGATASDYASDSTVARLRASARPISSSDSVKL